MAPTLEGVRFCETIPPNDIHAVSVSIPTWQENVDWARKDDKMTGRMKSGYPRFFVHSLVKDLVNEVDQRFTPEGMVSLPFASAAAAERCRAWMAKQVAADEVGSYSLHCQHQDYAQPVVLTKWLAVHVAYFKPSHLPLAKAFWQHSGEGISSRRTLHCLKFLDYLVAETSDPAPETPTSVSTVVKSEFSSLAAKRIIRNQIVSQLSSSLISVDSEQDIFLYQSGMKAIFDTSRAILQSSKSDSSEPLRLVAYGFVYVDTFKILSKLGDNDAVLYGYGTAQELDELEEQLRSGQRICALFTEFPTNPLLTCVDLHRIRKLADEYNFIVVCDDTVGTSVNLDLLPWVDVLVTSLTKLFSGACNAMGGSVVINPRSTHHRKLRDNLNSIFEDQYFPEDVEVMADNCIDFGVRVDGINGNAQAVASLLESRTDLVERVYYPSIEPSKDRYDMFKHSGKGYGYLITIKFLEPSAAIAFFDALPVAKGPSLGTNFTLACPYTLLAHYTELDFAAKYGVVEHLVRISVGLESDLLERIGTALDAAEAKMKNKGYTWCDHLDHQYATTTNNITGIRHITVDK